MNRVLTAVVLIPLVLLAVFRAPLWLFALVVGVVVILCVHEYLGMVERYGIKPLRWPVYLLSILIVVVSFVLEATRYSGGRRYAHYLWATEPLYLAIIILLPLIFGIPVLFRRELQMVLAASGTAAFGVLYIAISLSLLIPMTWTPGWGVLTVFTLFSVWAGDIAAYYVGRTLGRHKLAPVVSPNKTWEGAIASLIASVGVAFLVFHFPQQINSLFRAVPEYSFYPNPEDYVSRLRLPPSEVKVVLIGFLGVIANLAAQLGDLFESAIKRGAQMKDSGTLLPGHGGILDRIDALLFAIPAVWYYAELTHFYYSFQ